MWHIWQFAAKLGLSRVGNESGDDYLYPRGFYIPTDLPPAASRAARGAGRGLIRLTHSV